MPKFINTQMAAFILKDNRFLLNQHLLECYKLISDNHEKHVNKDFDIHKIINSHKKLINKLQINGKKKQKSLITLENFAYSKEKNIAYSILTNTLNNRKLFSI